MGEIDKTRPVFLYCAVGSRSAEAAQVLVQSGYSKVYALANGLAEWPYEIVK
jgi:rhodanese-related sulfurtransferase